jgi:hypothetical protein
MLNNKATAVKFEQDLGYLLTKEYDALAHYIISFYKKYDTIVEANFISYLEDNKDIIEAFTSVVNSVEEVFLSPQSVLGCLNKIKEYSVYKMVEELQQKIESTLDEDEKLEYANKKFELQRKIKKY